MIYPTKHEDLKQNLLVIGSEIIKAVRYSDHNIEEVYQLSKQELNQITLDSYYDALTFLWLMGFIEIQEGVIVIKKSIKDVSQETLF